MPLVIGTATVLPLALVTHRLRATTFQLERLLRTDVLTGLPNRRAFFERAEQSLYKQTDIVIMMIDIDHFKTVNDIHGHDVGDKLLACVAHTISLVISESDGTGERLTARIGGEEFGVLITGINFQEAGILAQRVVVAVRGLSCTCSGKVLRGSISLGVAHRSEGETVDELLRKADIASYRAKRLGRDQWMGFSPNETPISSAAGGIAITRH